MGYLPYQLVQDFVHQQYENRGPTIGESLEVPLIVTYKKHGTVNGWGSVFFSYIGFDVLATLSAEDTGSMDEHENGYTLED